MTQTFEFFHFILSMDSVNLKNSFETLIYVNSLLDLMVNYFSHFWFKKTQFDHIQSLFFIYVVNGIP